jgi:hypothetical protein
MNTMNKFTVSTIGLRSFAFHRELKKCVNINPIAAKLCHDRMSLYTSLLEKQNYLHQLFDVESDKILNVCVNLIQELLDFMIILVISYGVILHDVEPSDLPESIPQTVSSRMQQYMRFTGRLEKSNAHIVEIIMFLVALMSDRCDGLRVIPLREHAIDMATARMLMTYAVTTNGCKKMHSDEVLYNLEIIVHELLRQIELKKYHALTLVYSIAFNNIMDYAKYYGCYIGEPAMGRAVDAIRTWISKSDRSDKNVMWAALQQELKRNDV